MPKCRECISLKEEAHGPHKAGCFPDGSYRKWLAATSLDEDQDCELFSPRGDFDEVYIAMAAAAPEIQAMRGPGKWRNGDFYTCTTQRGPFRAYWTDSEDEPYEMFRPSWVPSQAQILRMVKCVDNAPHKLLKAIWDWLATEVGLPPPYASMEQILFAFMMHNNYRKTWISGVWVSE